MEYPEIYGRKSEYGKNSASIKFVKNRIEEQHKNWLHDDDEFCVFRLTDFCDIETLSYSCNDGNCKYKIEFIYAPDLNDYEYYTHVSNRTDGTRAFIWDVATRLLTEKIYPQLDTYKVGNESWFNDTNVEKIIYYVGDIVILDLYRPEDAPTEKPFLQSFVQACLPIKMVAQYKEGDK